MKEVIVFQINQSLEKLIDAFSLHAHPKLSPMSVNSLIEILKKLSISDQSIKIKGMKEFEIQEPLLVYNWKDIAKQKDLKWSVEKVE